MPRPGKWTVEVRASNFLDDLECNTDEEAEYVFAQTVSLVHSSVTVRKFNTVPTQAKSAAGTGTFRP